MLHSALWFTLVTVLHPSCWFTLPICYICMSGSLVYLVTSPKRVHSSSRLHHTDWFTHSSRYITQSGSLQYHATSCELVLPIFRGENLKRNDYNHFSFYQSYLVIQTLVLHVTSHFMVHSPSSLHRALWFIQILCYIS